MIFQHLFSLYITPPPPPTHTRQLTHDSETIKHCVFDLLLRFKNIFNVNNKSKYIITSNVIQGAILDRAQILPDDSKYIIVYRDPRDQYISAYDGGDMSVDEFINYNRYRIDKCVQDVKNNNNRNIMIPIRYERFVLNEQYRRKFCAKLDIKPIKESKYFNPDWSRTRIGKYKRFHDQQVIRKIELAFPELMDYSFENNFNERII